ncbi:MAG: S41 family peptidase [Pseudomonadota bacterium]
MLTIAVAVFALTSLCAAERDVVNEAADMIETRYVLEETAAQTATALRAMSSEATAAKKCAPPADFAAAFTKDLRKASGDGHFYIEHTTGEKDDWLATWRESGRRNAYGVTRVEIFKGNIGYIRIESFHELENAFPRYAAAFELIADTNGLILDLRGNGGGSPQTAWPMQWTFLEPGSPSLLKIESRAELGAEREEAPVLWKRYGRERPLAILIDDRTFSAPEAIAYSLQSVKRATVIGEPSAGGAHMLDDGAVIGGRFKLYIPTSRPVSTITGGNWEGVGVTPDIAASKENALETALDFMREQTEDTR